jgi:hypothetical protein
MNRQKKPTTNLEHGEQSQVLADGAKTTLKRFLLSHEDILGVIRNHKFPQGNFHNYRRRSAYMTLR